MAELIRWKVIVSGKVQGVAFRHRAAQKAAALSISGYVRNLEDGRVCLEAEGFRSDVIDFYNWCREGPPMARVLDIKTVEMPVENSEGFRILR